MRRVKLESLSDDQLVERFAAIAIAQDEALLLDEIRKFNRLFDQMQAVERTLKARDGDRRRALLVLYDHSNAQVRLKAAKATLAVEPDAARQMLRNIADSREYPQAGDAGMSLRNFDSGVYKPT